MYITINEVIGEKMIDLSYSIRNFGFSKEIAVISMFLFSLHHPRTAQTIKLKLSDFKDTPLRHFFQVKPVHHVLSCCHSNEITKGTTQNLVP